MDGRHSLPFKKKVVENRCSSDNKQQGKEVNKLSLLSEGHTKILRDSNGLISIGKKVEVNIQWLISLKSQPIN